jgi:hypothetical protein
VKGKQELDTYWCEPQQNKSDLESSIRFLRDRREIREGTSVKEYQVLVGRYPFIDPCEKMSVYYRPRRGRVTEIKNFYSYCCPIMQVLEYFVTGS